MTIRQVNGEGGEEGDMNGWWSADIDISRTPSPGVPAKRIKMSLQDIAQDFHDATMEREDDLTNLLRVERTPQELGYGPDATSWKELWFSSNNSTQDNTVRNVPNGEFGLQELTADDAKLRKRKMQTGCIPCL